jgi:hypothetical protein
MLIALIETAMQKKIRCIFLILAFSVVQIASFCQDLEAVFPRYTGNKDKQERMHDGGLPWAIGVHSYGVFRAFQHAGNTHDKEGLGYQFNHHPDLVYWKNYYWVSYQGGPTDGSEGDKPQVPYLISYSANGRNWEAPELLFPSIRFRGEFTYMHSRMGFYVSTSGRLLAISFHGRHKTPNGGGENGVARVVREIYRVNKNGRIDMGPVYAIRFNEGRTTADTGLEIYTASPDKGFVEACNELLNNKLVTQQWFEEDRRAELYTANLKTPNEGPDASEKNLDCKAFDWYTLPSGRIVGWWKGSSMAYSDDGWQTTSKIHVDFKRFNENRGAKMWGQKLSNNQYAMVYDLDTEPTEMATTFSFARTPLVVTSSADGLTYKQDRAVIFGDIPPSRYVNPPMAGGLNDNRDGGPQYVRGISESNTGKPHTDEPTGNMWLTYSVNKEDIWVSEVPAQIRHTTHQYPRDDFEAYHAKNLFGDWIILSPVWAPVTLEKEGRNKFMRLQDKDPYEYAKTMRVFPASTQAEIQFRIRPGQSKNGRVNIDVTDKAGKVAARLQLDETGQITVWNGASLQPVSGYAAHTWIEIHLSLDCNKQQYSLTIGGKKKESNIRFYEKTASLERFEIRTGDYRMHDFTRIGTWKHYPDTSFSDADKALPVAVFDLDDLHIK